MGWALVAVALAQPVPSDHTLIYYNARMALREGQPLEAVKLWLLRNTLEDQTGLVSPYDDDFRSVTWAALGQLGICQDGYATDDDGVGLWPIALHNWVVRNRGRKAKTKPPRPFEAFEVGRQQRFVSIDDVLGAQELGSVSLFRGGCTRQRLALLAAGEWVTADLADAQVSARLMQFLLERSRDTLVRDGRVRGRAAIEARLFDLHLQLTALAAREARMDAREQARRGRQLGLSRESVATMSEEAPDYTFPDSSEPARILKACVTWPVEEWMTLSPERRLFLFDHAKAYGGDPEALDRIALGILDELVARGEGEQAEAWIAHRVASDDVAARRAIWAGDRGQSLLTLDRESGFRERAVIALHRGVGELEGGDLSGALRSMAYALNAAPESRAAEATQGLSRRWLSYVASQFEITDELLVTLQELVPSRDYGIILEDLMWRAAFHADQRSFERGVEHQLGSGALGRRIELLEPLAQGNSGRFATLIRDGLAKSPSETVRLLDQLVQRLELEDADVRAAQLPTLRHVRELLVPVVEDAGNKGRSARTATALLERTQAIMEGLGALEADANARDCARSLSADSEVFAGSVRLAPADPLPWPFYASEVAAPSVFVPLDLTPEEWRDSAGHRILGWRIGG